MYCTLYRTTDQGLTEVRVTIPKAIVSRLKLSVVDVTPVDEHFVTLRLKHAFGFGFAVYTPANEKETFYTKQIVLGKFSIVSGCDRAVYEMYVGLMTWELISATRTVSSDISQTGFLAPSISAPTHFIGHEIAIWVQRKGYRPHHCEHSLEDPPKLHGLPECQGLWYRP